MLVMSQCYSIIIYRGISAPGYSDGSVGSFDRQIQSEYYGGTISVSIEGIALEHLSALPKADINSTTPSRQRHAVFRSFFI